jgi:hypothetical protein
MRPRRNSHALGTGQAPTPIQQGYEQHEGERVGYYQWGDSGTKYHYTPGNETARKRAKAKAEKQRDAARASDYDE